MGLAFWRRKKTSADAAAKRSPRGTSQSATAGDDDNNDRSDPGAALRVRARRRLIGAAALLLTVAVVVPMLLDPAPRPVSDNIAIDIPSEKTPFTPRLSLPPVPAPENAPLAPPADTPATSESPSKGEPEAKAADRGKAKAAASKEEEQRARTLLDGKSDGAGAASATTTAETVPAVVKGGKFAVQAAAPASETAAQELSDRLRKSGFAPYTERAETKDGVRYRVRVGPFATRDDADKARARLKAIGISANIVTA
jgi:DedD protein